MPSLELLLEDVRLPAKRGLKTGVRMVERNYDRVRARCSDALNVGVGRGHLRFGLAVVVQRVYDVGGGHLVAVPEPVALPQVEYVRRQVGS